MERREASGVALGTQYAINAPLQTPAMWLTAVTTVHYVDVEDTARLHVAAAILQDVRSERVFSIVDSFNWDQVLDILRKQNPGRQLQDNFCAGERIFTLVPKARSEELLRRMGQPQWTSLEDIVAMNTEDLRQAPAE